MGLSRDRAMALLVRRLPDSVRSVLERLKQANGQAWIVGGVVRDAFLDREATDWDVATDLEPAAVASLFSRVVRAGEKHGTIMVLTAAGPVEVTTFRSEGPYLDGRRPSAVVFETRIEADLSRRDFTMNAVACDPIENLWRDPEGGIQDIHAALIRAVGEPSLRFREDGLRPLRAVRFVATLDFEIEEATWKALDGAPETLAKVSWERRRVELQKLLVAPRAARGAGALEASGLRQRLFPGFARVTDFSALERCPPYFEQRLALFWSLHGVSSEAVGALAALLTLSRGSEKRVFEALRAAEDCERRGGPKRLAGVELRRWISANGKGACADAVVVLRARYEVEDFAARFAEQIDSAFPVSVADLAIRGRDLKAVGFDGARIGEALASMLERVLEDPSENTKERLLAFAHTLSTGPTGQKDP